MTNRDYYKCERYEKLNMGWINLTKEEKQSLILRYFKFLFENTDSTDVSGKPVDFILSKETLEDDYYRKSTNTKRSVVKGVNREWVYSLLHEQGLRTVITEFFNDYCIYDNEMTFLTQHFVSPLSSSLSQVMYNYNCSDTLRIDGVLCYKIDFIPKNDRFLAFRGCVLDRLKPLVRICWNSRTTRRSVDSHIEPVINDPHRHGAHYRPAAHIRARPGSPTLDHPGRIPA